MVLSLLYSRSRRAADITESSTEERPGATKAKYDREMSGERRQVGSLQRKAAVQTSKYTVLLNWVLSL